jgi:hypothetical protein
VVTPVVAKDAPVPKPVIIHRVCAFASVLSPCRFVQHRPYSHVPYTCTHATAALDCSGLSIRLVLLPQVKGDTHLIVRRPEDCNFFRDPGCKLPLPHIEMTPRLLRDREANFGKLLKDIHEQVQMLLSPAVLLGARLCRRPDLESLQHCSTSAGTVR